MTPHQSNRRGSLVLDRVFRGVGRLRRATGTKSVKLVRPRGGRANTVPGRRKGYQESPHACSHG